MKKSNLVRGVLRSVLVCLWGVLLGYGIAINGKQLDSREGSGARRDVHDNLALAANDPKTEKSALKLQFEAERKLFDHIMDTISKNYVEEVDGKKLYESAFEGVLSSLDPHSSYMTEKEFTEMKLYTEGEFGGLGIVVTKDSGFVKVISPIYDTPAERAGIKSGDFISEIDGKTTHNMHLNEAVDNMRGKPGSKVKLTILRVGESKPLIFNLKREIIKTNSVNGRLENGDIIYLKVVNFTRNTQKDLISTYNKLKDSIRDRAAPRGVILDLRNNPGGLLDQAIKVSELFLEKNVVIVSIKGRNDVSLDVCKSSAEKVLIDVSPVVVLVNEGSASASEIVAGALQDHKRGLIMGTKTFGKASVQNVFPLANGGALKMTIARYYTPSGRSIQVDGIEPDVLVGEAVVNFAAGGEKIREKDLVGHLKREDDLNKKTENEGEDIVSKSIRENSEQNGSDKKTNIKDYQLSKAIDLIIGISFYGKK
ncbi:MAG: S41 family peptidase [Rickettsiales bacterium]|jgi:carboxyl-terminal processing protease|nr:S41 family peptidase [Rickettsiales bacterium]